MYEEPREMSLCEEIVPILGRESYNKHVRQVNERNQKEWREQTARCLAEGKLPPTPPLWYPPY